MDQEVTTGMIDRGIDDLEWVDRDGWRRKIKLSTTVQLKKYRVFAPMGRFQLESVYDGGK